MIAHVAIAAFLVPITLFLVFVIFDVLSGGRR